MKRFAFCTALLGFVALCGAELPAEFKIASGDTTVRLTAASYWNLAGIWYKGTEVCRAAGAISGTTLNFEKKGWCGSGHKDSGLSEAVESVTFKLDGKEWTPTAGESKAQSFEMVKRSKLYSAVLEYHLTITPDRIVESNLVQCPEKVGNATIYHAMHPWSKAFTEYYYRDRKGKVESGQFNQAKRVSVFKYRPELFAAYAPSLKCGWLTFVAKSANFATADGFDITNRLVDRKLYYVPVRGGLIRPNWKTSSTVVTALFSCDDAAKWQQTLADQEALLKKSLPVKK